ncbi:MAG: ChbG/HpnK family deacetylase [Nitrospinota bacterium]
MKRVIINADDFGLCDAVNRGIVKGYREGILTSATIMANMAGFDQAVELAKENPGLGVGLHLNLLRGEPISQPGKVSTLLRNGRFLDSAGSFLIRLLSGGISEGEIETELRGQIEKALNAGLKITHFDSEKHLHSFPPIFKVALKLAVEYRIGAIRRIAEPIYPQLRGRKAVFWNPQFYKTILLDGLHVYMAGRIDRSGIRYADCFYGVLYSGGMSSEKYDTIFEKIQEGVTEIMCHPGYLASAGEISRGANYYINRFREIDLNGLLDQSLKIKAEKFGIQFINYGDIN